MQHILISVTLEEIIKAGEYLKFLNPEAYQNTDMTQVTDADVAEAVKSVVQEIAKDPMMRNFTLAAAGLSVVAMQKRLSGTKKKVILDA